ncbi:MAG: toll/interleukin-1 receptor domain-containing protein [Actinobacteria bacterium]|nr:toll/interleukin-1 receptor domain-containing protein [Actinomycetota bacterium]
MAVFISYHNSRSETVEHVVRYLQRHGIEAWYAPRNIPPGATWDEAIVSAIRSSEALVLLFDASADASKQIKREIHTADEHGIPIRWLRLEQIQPSGLEFFLGMTQWIDWLDARDEALEQLVASLPSRKDAPPPIPVHVPVEPEEEAPGEEARAEEAEEAGPAGESGGVDRDVTTEPVSTAPVLAPYTEWTPHPLPPMNEASWDDVVDGLVEIIGVEGPVLAHRVFQLYTRGMGGHRMGSTTTEELQYALERGLRQGRIAKVKDYLRGQLNKTLYIPGTPPAVPRQLGPRQLAEVPRSEIQQLVRNRGLEFDSPDVPRAVQEQLGLKRLTDKTVEFVSECMEYHHRV